MLPVTPSFITFTTDYPPQYWTDNKEKPILNSIGNVQYITCRDESNVEKIATDSNGENKNYFTNYVKENIIKPMFDSYANLKTKGVRAKSGKISTKLSKMCNDETEFESFVTQYTFKRRTKNHFQ